jgi:hypothetical protein
MGKRALAVDTEVRRNLAERFPESSTEAMLPNLAYIRERIQILQVARDLGMHVGASGPGGWTMVRCFRPERHKHGDSTPSLGFSVKNRYMCFGCDDRAHSNIDLVMAVKDCDLRQAVRWFDARYAGIPRKKVKLIQRQRLRQHPEGGRPRGGRRSHLLSKFVGLRNRAELCRQRSGANCMNHAHEIAAISERLAYLEAAKHVATFERSDRKVWTAPAGSLSQSLTAGADIFEVARALDRAPVGTRGAFVGDRLCTIADLDAEIGALQQRLRELR